MKMFCLFLLTVISVSSASAESSALFAECSGDHHGTYVDFYSEGSGVYIETTNDGEEPPVKYIIKEISRYQDIIPVADYQSAIAEALKTSVGIGEYEGMLIVRAESESNRMILNLNKWNGENFVVINDYVEKMECNVLQN